VPHVRLSVRGPNKTGEAHHCFYYRANQCRVPHISLVLREMWDTRELPRRSAKGASPIKVPSLMAVDHQAPWLGPSAACRGRQAETGCASVRHAAVHKLRHAKAPRCQGSLRSKGKSPASPGPDKALHYATEAVLALPNYSPAPPAPHALPNSTPGEAQPVPVDATPKQPQPLTRTAR
jgi:hypothetical protein